MTETVSIIVPYFNCKQYIDECVDSVLKQNLDFARITIIDDASTEDGTQEILQSQSNKSRLVNVIHLPENCGPSVARNKGIEASSAEYIIALDSDNYLNKNSIEKFLTFMRQNKLDFCYSWRLEIYESCSEQRLFEVDDYDYLRLLTQDNYIDTCGCFSRQSWEDIGGYDPEIMGFEDWDFWLSMGEHGKIGGVISDALYTYRVRRNSLTYTVDRDEVARRLRSKHLKLVKTI